MSMTIENMRDAVGKAYPGWKRLKTMSDEKVLAIYKSLQKRKKVR
jgi:hypothetical protein